MKPTKYTIGDTNKIDLVTKVIQKYPSPTKDFDIGKMVVSGRHPQKANTFALESACSFAMYILNGSGKVYADESVFDVAAEDVVFIPSNCKFAVEGQLEYLTVDVPAYYPEQSSEVTV